MSKSNGNAFVDFDLTKFGAQFGDFQKAMSAFKMPAFEGNALMDAQRKNMQVFGEANKVVFEGMQAMAQRQTEIFRQAAEEFTSVMRDMAKAESPEARLARQTALIKEAFEQSCANIRELAEMGVKSQSEAADMINARFSESLEEMKSAIETSTKAS